MEKSVANPKAMKASAVLGRFTECQRRLEEAGLSFEAFQWPIDDAEFRDRLVEFWQSSGGKRVGKSGKFPVWRTLKLGTGLTTADDFRKALKKSGNKIGGWADDMLGQKAFSVAATKEIEVDLVVVSVAELGFPNGATREKIYAKAQELGLELCPAEVGPQLRLQYKDQPNGERLLIGMEPITASVGNLFVFRVVRDGAGRWLCSYDDYAGLVWYGDSRWVFLRRK